MKKTSISELDRLRSELAPVRFRRRFHELFEKNAQHAVRLLNDEALTFPALLDLMPEIQAKNLYEHLTYRNLTAIRVTAKKAGDYPLAVRLTNAVPYDPAGEHEALKWMFSTSVRAGMPVNASPLLDGAVDNATALLLIYFDDRSILEDVVALLFARNRKGHLIHDLTWALFQTYDAQTLRQIAARLTSRDASDRALAARLLHVSPSRQAGGAPSSRETRREYLRWLDSNAPYLYLTGEHLQQTSKPEYLRVDRGAKVLSKRIRADTREPEIPLSDGERAYLAEYLSLPEEDQEALAVFSDSLHRSEPERWRTWMQNGIAEQVLSTRLKKERF